MSIAVAAVVRPSFWLRLSLAGFAASASAVALCLAGVGGGAEGAAPFALAGWSSAVCAAAAAVFWRLFALSLHRHRNAVWFDISAVGQLRAAVYQSISAAGVAAGAEGAYGGGADGQGGRCALLPGSTMWPGLLLLRLRGGDGVGTVLAVWPDSVASGLFRPLAAACRAVATHHMEH